MANVQHKLGLWSRDTSALLGKLHAAQRLGFEYVVARVVYHPNGPAEAYQLDALKQLIADALPRSPFQSTHGPTATQGTWISRSQP